MIRRLLKLAVLPAVCAVMIPASAMAQTGTIIDWGPNSYAWETNYNSATFVSNAGSVLYGVGVVNGFLGPLAGYTLGPGVEYTYYLEGFVSQGTQIIPVGTSTIYTTTYVNQGAGRLAFWQDFTPDAAFGTNPPNATAPSTFVGDNLFLVSLNIPRITITFTRSSTGVVQGGSLDTGEPTAAGPFFQGGLALAQVSTAAGPCPFRLTGGWLARPGNFPAGYTAHYDGKVDINCPVPATESTWGKVKAQYR